MAKIWIVAKTKARREMYAAENIDRQGYRPYVPLQQSFRGRGALRHAVAEPVFGPYVFVETPGDWRFLLGTYGVTSVIMKGEDPAVLPIAVLIELKKKEEGGFYKPRILQPGDQIRINSGSHEDKLGIYQGQTQKQRAMILMEFLGAKRKVEIDYSNIELVA